MHEQHPKVARRSTGDDPPDRLRDAADDLGFLGAWDNVDNANGIHR